MHHLEAGGDFNGDDIWTHLSHHVTINGRDFHIEAIAVDFQDFRTEAVNPSLQAQVDALIELVGETLRSIASRIRTTSST